VSVITPTWQRADLLLGRCVPAVQAQTYPNVEHVIVSDGPDPELAARIPAVGPTVVPIRFEELPAHGGHWGIDARLRGIELAAGDLITYCDDDDAYRPRHAEVLAAALEDPTAAFAYAQMQTWNGTQPVEILGQDPPTPGTVGTCTMHRRTTLAAGTWQRDLPNIDYTLVARWMAGGMRHKFVPEITCDCWCSCWNHPRFRDG
jgi:glycosyltransferase involved in cell wall biosynthesis